MFVTHKMLLFIVTEEVGSRGGKKITGTARTERKSNKRASVVSRLGKSQTDTNSLVRFHFVLVFFFFCSLWTINNLSENVVHFILKRWCLTFSRGVYSTIWCFPIDNVEMLTSDLEIEKIRWLPNKIGFDLQMNRKTESEIFTQCQ